MKALKIRDLPRIDRPREKLLRYGVDKLTNQELVALIIGSGNKENSVTEISNRVVEKFNANFANLTIKDLKIIKGVGIAKACELIASIELGKRFLKNKKASLITTPKEVWDSLKDVRESKKEHFIVFFLDASNQEIKKEIISIGTLTESLVHPREVFESAIKYSAAQIILAHNHPSGNLEPSVADLNVTKRLIAASKLLGIDILDHVIVTKEKWTSFKDNGLLKI